MHLILFSDMEDVQQIQIAPRCWWGLCWQEKPEGQNCKRNCHSRFVIYRWQRLKIKLRFFLSIIPLIWIVRRRLAGHCDTKLMDNKTQTKMQIQNKYRTNTNTYDSYYEPIQQCGRQPHHINVAIMLTQSLHSKIISKLWMSNEQGCNKHEWL